jgi:hypothetical protein
MKCKANELFDNYAKLDQLMKNPNPRKKEFTYTIVLNYREHKKEVEKIKSLLESHEGYSRYDHERIELCESYTERDEHGDPLHNEDGTYKIEDVDCFEHDLIVLQEKYNDELNEFATFSTELMEREIEIKSWTLQVQDLPDQISTSELNSIYNFISV